MREKNGFIATSVLYAFLVAFLTIFLGFMASYIQNKQLMNRIEDMAREDLDKYGNAHISDIEIGDYVIFDTIEDDGNEATVTYTAPINPDTKWILFKKEDTVNDSGKEETLYYFVSNADAQKQKWLAATSPYDSSWNIKTGTLSSEMRYSTLNTLSELMHANVYYDNASRTYTTMPSSVTTIRSGNYTKYFSYQFMYYLNGGIQVRFFDFEDVKEILNIRNDKIQSAIFDQRMNYTMWNDLTKLDDTELNTELVQGYLKYGNEGFGIVGYDTFTKDEKDSEKYLKDCIYLGIYKHAYGDPSSDSGYYDYCYYLQDYTGPCYGGGLRHSYCKSESPFNPRYVAIITVSDGDSSTDGRIDSGNGTSSLPYLITKGVK